MCCLLWCNLSSMSGFSALPTPMTSFCSPIDRIYTSKIQNGLLTECFSWKLDIIKENKITKNTAGSGL